MLAAQMLTWLLSELQTPLVIFGFAAQFIFFLRFAVQWFVSERRGRSHVPISFWYLSIVGGVMLLIYAAIKQDIVIAAGQFLSLIIYIRNLMLIYRRQARLRRVLNARTRPGFEPSKSEPDAEFGEQDRELATLPRVR